MKENMKILIIHNDTVDTNIFSSVTNSPLEIIVEFDNYIIKLHQFLIFILRFSFFNLIWNIFIIFSFVIIQMVLYSVIQKKNRNKQ